MIINKSNTSLSVCTIILEKLANTTLAPSFLKADINLLKSLVIKPYTTLCRAGSESKAFPYPQR